MQPTRWKPSCRFLLTRPSRGATDSMDDCWLTDIFLLTRPSRGATTGLPGKALQWGISTHTPLAGRDSVRVDVQRLCEDFYSHAPRGARRILVVHPVVWIFISTHTPLAGRDGTGADTLLFSLRFLLTRPSRGATSFSLRPVASSLISTHTPLAGRDDHPSAVFL